MDGHQDHLARNERLAKIQEIKKGKFVIFTHFHTSYQDVCMWQSLFFLVPFQSTCYRPFASFFSPSFFWLLLLRTIHVQYNSVHASESPRFFSHCWHVRSISSVEENALERTRFISGSGHDTNCERYLMHRDLLFCSIPFVSGCNESEAAKKAVLTHWNWSSLFLTTK